MFNSIAIAIATKLNVVQSAYTKGTDQLLLIYHNRKCNY